MTGRLDPRSGRILWLAVPPKGERSPDPASYAELAESLGLARLEVQDQSNRPEWFQALEDAEVDFQESPLSERTSSLLLAPRQNPFWTSDPLRERLAPEYLAQRHPGRILDLGPRFHPSTSLLEIGQSLSQDMLSAWLGGAPLVRVGPLPAWPLIDPKEGDGSFFTPLSEVASLLAQFPEVEPEQSSVGVLVPNLPDPEDERRCFEAWLLLKILGLRPRLIEAGKARRKDLNRLEWLVIPGTWSFSSDFWVTLGGWVRGGGTLSLSFDERPPSPSPRGDQGPPGPDFLHRLVGLEPDRILELVPEEMLRLKIQRNSRVLRELREIAFEIPAGGTGLSLWIEPRVPRKKSGSRRVAPSPEVEILAEDRQGHPALALHRLQKGQVFFSHAPLEGLAAATPGAFQPSHGSSPRRLGLDLARLYLGVARLAGIELPEGAMLEPWTESIPLVGRGGIPRGILVRNHGEEKARGKVSVPFGPTMEGFEPMRDRVVPLLKGQFHLPLEPGETRGIQLRRKESPASKRVVPLGLRKPGGRSS